MDSVKALDGKFGQKFSLIHAELDNDILNLKRTIKNELAQSKSKVISLEEYKKVEEAIKKKYFSTLKAIKNKTEGKLVMLRKEAIKTYSEEMTPEADKRVKIWTKIKSSWLTKVLLGLVAGITILTGVSFLLYTLFIKFLEKAATAVTSIVVDQLFSQLIN
jgi:hypothetical protein